MSMETSSPGPGPNRFSSQAPNPCQKYSDKVVGSFQYVANSPGGTCCLVSSADLAWHSPTVSVKQELLGDMLQLDGTLPLCLMAGECWGGSTQPARIFECAELVRRCKTFNISRNLHTDSKALL